MSEQFFERRDAAVGYPARNDEVEVLEGGVHIERKAVAGDPAGNADADGRQLLIADPRARESGHATGGDTETGRSPDHHFFEIADVTVNVTAVRLQIEYRIADKLPRPMVGDVAAAA